MPQNGILQLKDNRLTDRVSRYPKTVIGRGQGTSAFRGGAFYLASKQLINAVNGYENYIQRKGVDEQVIDAYIQAVAVALRTEHDVDYGLKISARAKQLIASYVKQYTGGRVADLEVYAGEHDTTYKVLQQFYDVLMYESAYLVDSFFITLKLMKRIRGKDFISQEEKCYNL